MPLFDRHVVIDWSAAARPVTGADSIWVADVREGSGPDVANLSTRSRTARWLDELVDAAAASGERVLVGIDAGLGYPAGAAAHFGLDGEPWRATWAAIAARSVDDERNRNNRFEVAAELNRRVPGDGPFWGCPDDRYAPALRRTKPADFGIAEFRMVEERLRRAGRHPKSVWQLLGAGSVGGQTLTLLPLLQALLPRIDVWPFTTGLGPPAVPSGVVVAEVWPTMFVGEVPAGVIRDAAQVSGTAAALAEADRAGSLGGWFSPDVTEQAPIIAEEGWVLGVV